MFPLTSALEETPTAADRRPRGWGREGSGVGAEVRFGPGDERGGQKTHETTRPQDLQQTGSMGGAARRGGVTIVCMNFFTFSFIFSFRPSIVMGQRGVQDSP